MTALIIISLRGKRQPASNENEKGLTGVSSTQHFTQINISVTALFPTIIIDVGLQKPEL